MKQLSIFTFFLMFALISFGQNAEYKFYSYLQTKISTELSGNNSLIIDQFSDKDEKYNWQVKIKPDNDSCIVTFLPPQYSQDTMVLPGELVVINEYKISRTDLVSSIQQIKENYSKEKNPKVVVSISIELNGKIKEFHLSKVAGLYNKLRYNKLSFKFEH